MSDTEVGNVTRVESRENEPKQIDRTIHGDVKSGIVQFSHGDHQPVCLLQVISSVSPEGQWKAVRMRDRDD